VGDWTHISRRREFLNEFAAFKQFDPLDKDKWYSVKLNDILSFVSILYPSDELAE
jgi:hypothetical protein